MSYITIDRTRTYQPYFQAYINSKGLKHGDIAKTYEYIAWITTKHREFRIKENLERKPYTKGQEKQFIRFIDKPQEGIAWQNKRYIEKH